jgi:type VII secretion system ESX-1 substrate
VGVWTGAAADAFRARFADVPGRWSRAAAAFRSAAQEWERFRTELVAAQEQAATAVARFQAAAAETGGATGPGAAATAAARQLLADARARRDRSAEAASREIAAAAALAPDPPAGWDRLVTEGADWVQARGIELAHVGAGAAEGVEDVVRFARIANPTDPYNLNHPGRFVANASTALAGAVDDVVHPLRQVAGLVGSGWRSDPARAAGHLLPTVLLACATGVGRSVVGAAGRGRPALGAAARMRQAPLWADPRPTARPFEAARSGGPDSPSTMPEPAAAQAPTSPPPVGDAVAAADRAVGERLEEIGRRMPADRAKLMPKDVAAPDGPPRPGPHHDPQRARRARVTRADKDFTGTRASRGNRKSHLDEHGHLVPANPAGGASVVEHVGGRRSPTKGDSPYSSFTAPGAHAAVEFGGSTIEVDVVRLQADIDAGRVTDVEILPAHRVQAAIQADADRIVGRPVDLYVRKGRIPAAARSYGLDAEATAALRQRMIDMANAQRHHEWMIRGVVPSRYIVGPYPGRSHG